MSSPRFVRRSITLEPHERRRIHEYSNFFMLFSNSLSLNPGISLNNNPIFEIEAGIALEMPQDTNFPFFDLYNPSDTPMTLVYYLGTGRIWSNVLTVADEIAVRTAANELRTAEPIAVTVIPISIPAEAQRRELFLTNTGTDTVWVGDVDVNINRGIPINPGGTLILNTSTAVYLRSASGTQIVTVAKLNVL